MRADDRWLETAAQATTPDETARRQESAPSPAPLITLRALMRLPAVISMAAKKAPGVHGAELRRNSVRNEKGRQKGRPFGFTFGAKG